MGQELIPRIQFSNNGPSSYTFVTGCAGGHPEGKRSALGEINTHHVWGLSAALRNERLEKDINCRELRIRLPVNRPTEERENEPRERPLSEDIGTLCAGLVATHPRGGRAGGAPNECRLRFGPCSLSPRSVPPPVATPQARRRLCPRKPHPRFRALEPSSRCSSLERPM